MLINIITITYPAKQGYIISNIHGGKVISSNGVHVGICYNGFVYCNVHPTGLKKKCG